MTSSKLDATTNKWLRSYKYVRISHKKRVVWANFYSKNNNLKNFQLKSVLKPWLNDEEPAKNGTFLMCYLQNQKRVAKRNRKIILCGIEKNSFCAILLSPSLLLSLSFNNNIMKSKKDLFKRQLQFPSSCSSLIWMLYKFFFLHKKKV